MLRSFRRALLGLLPVLLASGMEADGAPIRLTVMAQNLYVGADTTPLLTAPDLATAAVRAAEAFDEVLANDFPARAAAIASEIEAADGPPLIGLQEASIIGGRGMTLDYAQILLDQLANLGLDYTIAGVHTGSSVALGGFSAIDRDIVLARTDISGFTVTGNKDHTFANNLTVPTVFGPISTDRGYVVVDATLDGVPFQFVSTHLEALDQQTRQDQAEEILSSLNTSTEPQLLVGDFNASPTEQTYQNIIAAGFADAAAAVGAIGPTCCQERDLSNPVSDLRNRFDYIFERNFSSIDSASLIGDIPFQAVPPLWPSDHAGVVATAAVPEPSSMAVLAASTLLFLSIFRGSPRRPVSATGQLPTGPNQNRGPAAFVDTAGYTGVDKRSNSRTLTYPGPLPAPGQASEHRDRARHHQGAAADFAESGGTGRADAVAGATRGRPSILFTSSGSASGIRSSATATCSRISR